MCELLVKRHIEKGKPVQTRPDLIYKSVWPDVPKDRANHSFSTTKSALRKRLLRLYKSTSDMKAPLIFVTESNSLAYLLPFFTAQISSGISRQDHLSPELRNDWSTLCSSIDSSLDELGRPCQQVVPSAIDRVIAALGTDSEGTKVARELRTLRELLTVLAPQLRANVSATPPISKGLESYETTEKKLFENVVLGLPDFFKVGLFLIETQKHSPDAASKLMGMPLGEVVEIMRDGYETAVQRTVQQLAVLQSSKPL